MTQARIGMISQWYDPEQGAAAVPGVIARSLVRQGHLVDVVTGFPNYPGGKLYPGYSMRPYARERSGGVTVHRVPFYPSHDSSPVRRAASYLSFAGSASVIALAKLDRVDSVLVHLTPATAAIPAVALKILRRKPYVLHVEDLWPHSVTSSGFLNDTSSRHIGRVLNAYCDSLYRHALVVAVTSPGMADLVASRGISRKKIEFVPNWADEEVFRPVARDPALAGHLGIKTQFTVMYAGNFGKFQSLDTLLGAANLLRQNSRIGFVLAGGGVEDARLRSLVAQRGLSNVQFIGPQPYVDMASVMALGDVLYVGLRDLPLFRMTLPSKLQAALAAGRPIVGSLNGDGAQALRDADAGVVVDPGSMELLAAAILSLSHESDSVLARFGQNGREFYERTYSEAVVARRLSRLLQRAVGRLG